VRDRGKKLRLNTFIPSNPLTTALKPSRSEKVGKNIVGYAKTIHYRGNAKILIHLRHVYLFKCTHEGTLIRWEGKRVRIVTRIGRSCSLERKGTSPTK